MKRTIYIILLSIALFVALALILLSPIVKYLVQKYDVKYTGREITISSAYLNPFTGYLRLNNLMIYEQKSDSIFLEAKSLRLNMELTKLLGKTYEISSITLEKPLSYVIQKGDVFNFSDLIEKFSSSDSSGTEPKSEPTKFNMLDIEIIDGEFHFIDTETPINYFIKNVNINSSGLKYNVDTLPINFAFSSGMGSGDVEGDININLSNLDYNFNIEVDTFNLEIINQYLKDLTNYGTFKAYLDARITSSGNFTTSDSISTTGNLTFTDFHFGKDERHDFASFDKLVIAIQRLRPSKMIYYYDSISLRKPFFSYEMYDQLDNIQNMFGVDGENLSNAKSDPTKFNLVIAISDLVQNLSRNLLASQYKVGRLAVYDGDFRYIDYSLSDKFSLALSPFSLSADSIDKSRDRVSVHVNSQIKPYGNIHVNLSIDPIDSSFFDLDFKFKNIPLPMFNPYFTKYTSFPMDKGNIEISGDWKVRDGIINSMNHLIIIDPRITKRVKNDNNGWIPLPLAMALVRERGNVIDFEVPIKGNLRDPNVKIRDIVLDILENIFVKPVTTPYRVKVSNIESELEKSHTIKWPFLKSEVTNNQEKYIQKIVKYLDDNPSAEIVIKPFFYTIKESEFALLFEAKKLFYLSDNSIKESSLTKKDTTLITNLSIKDPKFRSYLDKQVTDQLLFTVQDKSLILVKNSKVDKHLENLKRERKSLFLSYFEKDKMIDRVKFSPSKSSIPFYGFSYFEIIYKDELPQYLIEAFETMNHLNQHAPREKYSEKRKKIIDKIK